MKKHLLSLAERVPKESLRRRMSAGIAIEPFGECPRLPFHRASFLLPFMSVFVFGGRRLPVSVLLKQVENYKSINVYIMQPVSRGEART